MVLKIWIVFLHYVITEILSYSMSASIHFYDKPLSRYLDPKTVHIYRPHPVKELSNPLPGVILNVKIRSDFLKEFLRIDSLMIQNSLYKQKHTVGTYLQLLFECLCQCLGPPEPIVSKAFWRNITGFKTSLSKFLGDPSFSASFLFRQKPD
jgi:hypothetical protein